MSIHLMSKAWKYQTSDPHLKLVLLKLADNASDEGYCFPSLTRIQKETGLCRATVCRKMILLEELGFVRRKPGNFKKSTRYLVWIPDPENPKAPAQSDFDCPERVVSPRDYGSLPGRPEPSVEPSRSKETKATVANRPVFSPLWKPIQGTKEQKLAWLKVPKSYPSEQEFEDFLNDEGLDSISAYRPDLYSELCNAKWHHWMDEPQRWERIINWRKFVEGLDLAISNAHP